MVNSLTGALGKPVRAFTLSDKYRGAVESLRLYFQSHPTTQVVSLTGEQQHLYRGDLMGLLDNLGARREDHYLIMRTNDLTSMHDVDDYLTTLYLPAMQVIDNFKKMFEQSNRSKK